MNWFLTSASVYSSYAVSRFSGETRKFFDVLESRLSEGEGGREWLAGDKYSLADICNFAWVRGAPIAWGEEGWHLDQWPNVGKWAERINAREAVKKALNVPDMGISTVQLASIMKQRRDKVEALKTKEEV